MCHGSGRRFFELYQPAIVKFAENQGAAADAEDIAQQILLKLVDVLRAGRYSGDAGHFRSYLATAVEEEPIKSVASRFGVSEDVVYQTKSRVARMVAAIESEMDG